MELGNAELANHEYLEATAELRKALQMTPGSNAAMSGLAAALLATGHRDEGLETLAKSAKMNPGDARARANYGIVLLGIPNRMDEGIAELREAVRIDPGNDSLEAHPGYRPRAPPVRSQVNRPLPGRCPRKAKRIRLGETAPAIQSTHGFATGLRGGDALADRVKPKSIESGGVFRSRIIVDIARQAHMRLQVDQLRKLEARLREGGGAARIAKQHAAGKMTARERIAALLDAG